MRKLNKVITLAFLILFFLGTVYAENKPKDVVLVVDVSKSMIGIGNKGAVTQNIFPDVKKKLHVFVNNLHVGDTVYFILFGTDVYDTMTFDIKQNSDLDGVRSYVDSLKATDQLTYMSKMLSTLSELLENIRKTSTKKVQLSVIFTDAIDDPPTGKEKSDVSNVTQSLDNKDGNNRYVYYFSLNPGISQKLKAVIASYFPEVMLYDVGSGNQLNALTQEAIDNLKPTIEVSAPVAPYKPFEYKSFPVRIDANKEAAGLKLAVSISQGQESYLKIDQPEITLQEGINTVTINSEIPIRFDGDWDAKVNFDIDSILDTVVKPSNPVDLKITALPLSFKEKLSKLPEYYVTLIILILLILVGLFFLIKYLTFVPLLELHYWLTAQDEAKAAKSSKFDPLNFGVEKNTLNVTETENGQYLISSDADANPLIHLEHLTKFEFFNLALSGEKRKKKLRIVKEDKAKIIGKKNVGGKFFRDKSYFRIGKYSFAVKTNLK